MTINRNGPDKLGRTFQASATEIQANLLNRKRPQLNEKIDERRGAAATTMRTQQRPSSTTASRQQRENAFAKSRAPQTMMSHHQQARAETAAEAASSRPMMQQEVWTSTEDLFWDHMREVQNKWNTLKLNDDIWAKLIYFEQNRRLAKAYVSTPVLTIDGSTNGLDGFRIGLSGIENSYRDLDSIACLRSIGQGIKLKIDHQGNILIKKLMPLQRRPSQGAASNCCSVWVKDWPSAGGVSDDPALDGPAESQGAPLGPKGPTKSSSNISNYSQLSSSSYSSSSGSTPSRSSLESQHRSSDLDRNSNWPMQEISEPDMTYKLFDMQKFRSQLERSRRLAERNLIDGTSTSTPIDWRQCVSIISFDRRRAFASRLSKPQQGLKAATNQNQEQALSDPCWLMLINIIAIDMLKSSVCDSVASSPQSQTSNLINRYQNDNLRMAARKLLPPLPVANSHDKLGPISWAGHNNQLLSQYNQQTANSLERPAEFKSDRLRRLNRRRHDDEEQTTATTTMTSLSTSSKQFDSNKSSSGQLEGSIYTTFTGKYLDKQHRRRVNEVRHGTADDFELERGPHLVMSKLSERKSSAKANESRYSMGVSHYDRRSSYAPNPAGLVKRMPTGGNQLTHSLSAFDLSHGLKLNMRSINVSSIKMNFDDDDLEAGLEADMGEEDLESDRAAREHDRGLEMLTRRKAGGAQEDLFSKLRLKTANEKTLAGLARNQRKASRLAQDASSEWIDLAKKYASIRDSNEPAQDMNEEPPEGMKKEYDDNKGQSYNADGGEGLKQSGADSGEGNSSTLQQNKSRSSIASSSSGCADNDYFNSQSSPSSMSSSTTRSNGAEELTSQPASSSGINSASDDYERCEPKQQTDDGIEVEPTGVRETSSYKEQQQQQQQQQQLQPTRRPTSATSSNYQKGSRSKSNDSNEKSNIEGESHNTRHKSNVKKAISLSRGNNGKAVLGMGPIEAGFECLDCQHPGDVCDDQEQCDCGAPTCDRMMFPLDEQMSSPHEICDCYCDCLFQAQNGQTAPGRFAHQTHCQDEMLCDCGAGQIDQLGQYSAPPSPPDDQEEPIYDHLPRFGRVERETRPNGTGGKRTAEALLRSPRRRIGGAARGQQERTSEDADCIVPLPASTLDRQRQTEQAKLERPLKKSSSATNLKRTGGWLEGNKYMKLLPRFISFSSKPEGYSNRKLPPMEKSSTFDRAGQLVSRFTRSRSSQNLTK